MANQVDLAEAGAGAQDRAEVEKLRGVTHHNSWSQLTTWNNDLHLSERQWLPSDTFPLRIRLQTSPPPPQEQAPKPLCNCREPLPRGLYRSLHTGERCGLAPFHPPQSSAESSDICNTSLDTPV